jgi:hypothetical protein
MPVGAKNDTELSRRQCSLESFERNKAFQAVACALRQGLVMGLSITRAVAVHLPFPHFLFPNGSR